MPAHSCPHIVAPIRELTSRHSMNHRYFQARLRVRCADFGFISINYGQAEIGFPDIRLADATGDLHDSL